MRPGSPCIAWCLVLAVLASVVAAAAADDPPRYTGRVWGQADGLPVSFVGGIVATPDGYLWLGTLDGLVRFDGVRFSVLDAGNTDGLDNNLLPDVGVDPQGRLWAWGAAPWLSVVDAGEVRTYGTESGLPRIGLRQPRFSRDGTVWVAMARGLYVLRGDRFVPAHPDLAALNIPAMWVSRAGEVLVFPLDAPARVLTGQVTASLGIPTQVIDACETADGVVWMAAIDGVYRRDPSGAVTRVAALTRGRPTAIGADADEGIWLGTSAGLFRVVGAGLEAVDAAPVDRLNADAAGAVWTASGQSVRRNGIEVYRAPGDVTAIVAGPEGNLWLGTATAGVVRLQQARVESLAPDTAPLGVAVDPTGRLWVADAQGVAPADGDGPRHRVPGGAGALTFDRHGTLWVAGAALYRLRGQDLEPVPAAGPDILDVDETSDGAIWAVRQGELRRWSDDVWETFGPRDGTSAGPMQFGDEAPDGTLWFTTPEGLLRFRDGRFDLYTEADGLSSNRTRSVRVDPAGTVWVGTEGRGINRIRTGPGMDGRPLAVRVIREVDGLHENGISALELDGTGGVWMGTNRGIVRATRDDLEAFVAGRANRVHPQVFDARDGLASGAVPANGGSLVALQRGVLYFATGAGVARVEPGRLSAEPPPPPVIVEALRVQGTSRPAGREVRLAPGEDEFELSFTAPSFTSPEHLTFRYRLAGFHDSWVETGTRRIAYFTNVPPGDYRFEVQAANRTGDWGPGPTVLHLVVAPAWYENVWYRRLAGILALAAGALVIRGRLRVHQRRARELAVVVRERTRDLEAEKASTEAARHAEAEARRQAEAQRAVAEEAMETAQRQAARLWEMDQAKSRFFANISHEFRTPLTLTIGPLEDVVTGMHGEVGAEARRELEMAIRNSRAVLDLVNQILELARLEAGQDALQATLLDLGPLLREAARDFSTLADRRGIQLGVAIADDPLPVRGNASQLRRVATNLLANAFKFTEAGGRVTISAEIDGAGDVAFAVTDTGIGIAREELDRIFDRFYQAHAGQHASQPGTGIGLSLARELVELHDGRIEVDSERGAGSRFSVVLPRQVAGAQDVSVPVSEPQPVGDGREAAAPIADSDGESADQPLVMIVDDHAELRALVRKHLGSRFRVVEAADGAAALASARDETPDLIVSDVMMPGLDGFALLGALRADPGLDFVPVILLTARDEVADRVSAYGLGADGYLAKPFHAAELVANVEAVLRTRRRLRERYRPTAGDARPEPRSADEAYLEAVTRIIDDHLGDEDFSLARLAHLLGQGRSQMFARLGEAAGMTPAEMIKQRRLQRAAEMLEAGAGSVGEIAYAVGFKSVSHFSRAFREAYGCTPTERMPGRRPATT